jgi:hypothetical protein
LGVGSLAALEELDLALVPEGSGAGAEGAEVAAVAGAGVGLAAVEAPPPLARELADDHALGLPVGRKPLPPPLSQERSAFGFCLFASNVFSAHGEASNGLLMQRPWAERVWFTRPNHRKRRIPQN